MGVFQFAEQYFGIIFPIQVFYDPKIKDSSQKPSCNSYETADLALWFHFISFQRAVEHCSDVIFSQ